MGTDQFGRDVLSRWLYAARPSLVVALSSVVVASVLGSLLGLIAGYKHGGLIDAITMRMVDAIISLPLIVLVIALAGTLGTRGIQVGSLQLPSYVTLVLVLSITFVPPFARISKAGALAEMQEDYVSAARVLGAGMPRLLFLHLLPNVLPPLVIQASFSVALAISVEATVSFLGFGIQPPEPSWGNMLTGSRDYILGGKWWLIFFPATVIVLAVFAFNLLGDGLRDWLDPRQTSTRSL
jgi:ABC-type dipeptide/oligopeptide/nickel transport system permease subunit